MKRSLLLWVGTFNYAHEVITKYTHAPTWAAAKSRMLHQLAKDHGVGYNSVYGIFDGTRDNFLIEEVKK